MCRRGGIGRVKAKGVCRVRAGQWQRERGTIDSETERDQDEGCLDAAQDNSARADRRHCSLRDLFFSVILETSDDLLVGQQRSPSLAPVMGGIKYYARLGNGLRNLELPSRRPVSALSNSSSSSPRRRRAHPRRRPSSTLKHTAILVVLPSTLLPLIVTTPFDCLRASDSV